MKIILPKERLYSYYIEEFKSSGEISKIFNCSVNTVLRNLRTYNISVRKHTNVERRLIKPINRDLLERLYVKEGKSSVQIAKILGATFGRVIFQLKYYGLQVRCPGSKKIEIEKNTLYSRYVVAKESAGSIAKDYSCTRGTILNWIRYYGFKVDKKRYMTGYKPWLCGENSATKRPEVRAKMRANHADVSGSKNNRFGKPPLHGKKQKYKDVWMRSSWEVLYAKYLDQKKIKWVYEPKTFNLGNCTYTPDFYLPKKDLYIEIKGYWRDKSKKKFELFKRNYSNISIKLLMKEDLQKIGVL